jgi:hypothetical protein
MKGNAMIEPQIVNFLKNANQVNIWKAKLIVLNEAFIRLTPNGTELYEAKYRSTVKDYFNEPKLLVSSVSFDLDKLDSFKPWLNELVEEKNKFMPIIIGKMLGGDPMSLSLYKSVYSHIGQEEMIIRSQLYGEGELRQVYIKSGAGISVEATLTAEYWLNSEEGQNVLCSHPMHGPDLHLLVDC